MKIDIAVTLDRAGMSQYKLAKILRVQATQVWRWYHYISYPQLLYTEKLIKIFKERNIKVYYVKPTLK